MHSLLCILCCAHFVVHSLLCTLCCAFFVLHSPLCILCCAFWEVTNYLPPSLPSPPPPRSLTNCTTKWEVSGLPPPLYSGEVIGDLPERTAKNAQRRMQNKECTAKSAQLRMNNKVCSAKNTQQRMHNNELTSKNAQQKMHKGHCR